MPELPEVEAARQKLERWTHGHSITRVEVLDDKLAVEPKALVGHRIREWQRRGKTLVARLPDGALFLHLGMTGKLVQLDADRPYQRLRLHLKGHPTIAFIDPRRFGDARTISHEQADALLAELGPDALDQPLAAADLKTAMGRGKTALKARLLDQHRVAGLGNIAVIEACWRAKIHPHTPIDAVPERAWKALVPAIRDHLQATLAHIDPDAELTYLSEGADSEFEVYAHDGLPCPRCKSLIAKDTLAGRPTFFCPKCQPL